MLDTSHFPSRSDLEAHIDACIDLLDRLDPDPDLEEPGDLEASLGWEGGTPIRCHGAGDDRELDLDSDEWEGWREGDGRCDDEPSLAGGYWGPGDDREVDEQELELA